MQKKLFIFLFLILNFIFSNAFADAASDQLKQLLTNMQSMQASFSQTTINKKGKAVQQSTGVMYLQRPSQFRWDVKSPMRQLVVTNGVRLWIYDPELEQVTIRKLTRAVGETPALLLSDKDLSLAQEFTVTPISTPAAQQAFQLIPKDKSSMISALQLRFANGIITEMQLRDHLGHNTLIRFHNVKTNIRLSSSLFAFKPPAHVDVIDETRKR